MLKEYFDNFICFTVVIEPDGMGGTRRTLQNGYAFKGALAHAPAREIPVGGRATLHAEPLLLHEREVHLKPGQAVWDPARDCLYAVCGDSADRQTPRFSGLNIAATPLEGWRDPC